MHKALEGRAASLVRGTVICFVLCVLAAEWTLRSARRHVPPPPPFASWLAGTLDGANKDQVRKWGRGGPGYNIKAEFNPRKHEFGVLSMARSNDPDSAGSQFFICLGDLASLDNKYTTFGKLTQGGDVLRKLASAKTVTGDIPFERQGLERIDPL